jgi:heme/copper-type cytochrome/quinol oxidase subunit 2
MAIMMKLSERARRLYPLVLASAALSGCDQGVLDPAGPVGGAERVILLDSLVVMLPIVLPTILCAPGSYVGAHGSSGENATVSVSTSHCGAFA